MLQKMSPETPRTLGVDIDAKGYRLCGEKIIPPLITILILLCRNPWSKIVSHKQVFSRNFITEMKQIDTDSPRSVEKKAILKENDENKEFP